VKGAITLVVIFNLFLPPSHAQGRVERIKREKIADIEKGIVGAWKLRDAHHYYEKPKMHLVSYHTVRKEYGIEHLEFLPDHTFSWISTKDSATHTGTWAVVPFDRNLEYRVWGREGRPIVTDDYLAWSTDLVLKYGSGPDAKSVRFDDVTVERRFGKPVKIAFARLAPNAGRDYILFYFVRDTEQ
jgi:hypothetical protein